MNQLAAAVAGRIDRLLVPLQQALRVGERPVLLGVAGGGKEEDLGADVVGRSSPRSTSGESFQNVAVSTSTMSRTTSHFSFASAGARAAHSAPPTAGFWPMTNRPSILPSAMSSQ